MACKFIYDGKEFDSKESILQYINTKKLSPEIDQDSFFNSLETAGFFEALDIAEQATVSAFSKRVAKAIKKKAQQLKDYQFTFLVKDEAPEEFKRAIALTEFRVFEESPLKQSIITVFRKRKNELTPEYILHEGIHAITAHLIHNEPDNLIVRKLDKLTLHIQKSIKNKVKNKTLTQEEQHFLNNTNAFSTIHEILAWGLTDQRFQEYLKTIQYNPDKSAWDIFVSFILDILGLKDSDTNALAELLGISNELLDYSAPTFGPFAIKLAIEQTPGYITEDLRKTHDTLTRDDTTSTYKGSNKSTYDSVTGKVIPLFQERPFDPNFNPGQADADIIWKNTPKDTPQRTSLSGDQAVTYEEHIQLFNNNRNKFLARAELYHLKFHQYFSGGATAVPAMESLMSAWGITDSEIDWLTTPVNGRIPIRTILENRTSTDFWVKGGRDKIETEMNIKSDILGWAGRVDLMIDHGDNVLSFFDIKTGYGINREFQNYLLKYGDTRGRVVWDNALNRAKLQLMLYAVIAKSENPSLRFRNLKVLHIPSESDKHYDSVHNNVDAAAFLEIIQNFLEAKEPTKFKKLLEKSPDIFNAEHYNATTLQGIGDRLRPDSDPSMELKLRILELQKLIMYDKNIVDRVVKGRKGAKERYERIKELMEQIIELKKDKSISYAAWDTDLSWMDSWLGSASYSTNPYVQLYYKILSEQKQKARNKYQFWREKFNGLLKKALEEIGATSPTNLVGGPARDRLFRKLLIEQTFGETYKVTIVTDKDTERWNSLTKTQQDLADFINDSIGYFFDDNLSDNVDPRTGKTVALANKVVTYKDIKGQEVPITNLQLHNREVRRQTGNKKHYKSEYYRGFYPKHMMTLADVSEQHSGYLSKGMLKYLWNKYATNYFEVVYDQWGNTTEGIPMKYMGSPIIDNAKNFTMNLELAVDSFVKQHFYKQYVDDVYTFGQGIKLYLAAKQNEEDSTNYKRTIQWFEDSINLHILGRKDPSDDWITRKLKRQGDNSWEQFNFTKFLRSLRLFFTGPTMWLKPVNGLANFVFASIVTLKEGLKNQFFISGPHSNFDLGDVASGFSIAMGMQFDAAQGKLRQNKAYLLMEKFGYLPDNYDWYTRPNELLTARNKLFTSRTMMFFHMVPEEVIATAMFVAQLRSMKTPDGQSIWDHYKPKATTLSTGEVYHTVEWDGTVRGKRNISNIEGIPEYEDVTELIPEEVNAIKFLYEKIHGGYRLDERVRAEYYVIGELLMQFKKYLPGILKNTLASRGYRNTQGFLKEETDEQGNKVLKWTPQVVEGRWRLVMGLLLNYLNIRRNLMPNGTTGSKLGEHLRIQPTNSYDWSKLSETQKEDVIDLMLTTTMWALLLLGYNLAWDRDDEDSLKKVYARIMNDVTLQANPLEVTNSAVNFGRPVTINKFAKLLNSTVETTWSTILLGAGYDDAALTEQGNLRGAKELQRNLHFLSAYHDVYKFLDESPDLQEGLELRLK